MVSVKAPSNGTVTAHLHELIETELEQHQPPQIGPVPRNRIPKVLLSIK
jgi:hypothetical protein